MERERERKAKLEQSAIENAPLKHTSGGGLLMTSSWCGKKEKHNLLTFLHHLNSIHPTIKSTHEYSNSSHQSLPFLDVQVHLDNSLIETDLHTKATTQTSTNIEAREAHLIDKL